MIEIKDIQVARGTQTILHEMNWRSERGEHWLIQGPNGCGKSTFLELIAGYVQPLRGSINYDFITSSSWEERFQARREKIHYVSTHAIQTFLNQQDIYYQQRYYSLGDERVPKVIDVLGGNVDQLHAWNLPGSFSIDALLPLDITRLSNGQLKKVIILKNFIKHIPEVLLLDYPFEGLDKHSKKDLRDFIDYLVQAHNIHVLLVDVDNMLPGVINRKLELEDGHIKSIEKIAASTGPPIDANFNTAPPGEGEVIVEMKKLTIQYGQSVIINDLNWRVCRGERWALVGANGSGKTTLFSLIYADHPLAYSQQVFLFGQRRGSGESIWDIKRRISYLGPEVLAYLGPAEATQTTLNYLRSIVKNKNMEARLVELIGFFAIDRLLNKTMRQLSSGERQLVLLIAYFVKEAELLLLDEPFQFLDPQKKNLVQVYLQHHLKPETTMILITHDPADVKYWTEKVLQL
jgi:molybdate transport system ATP-binding protein